MKLLRQNNLRIITAFLVSIFLPLAAFSQTEEKLVQYTGTLISQDFSAMPVDGPGIFTVKSDNNKILTVQLASGESACDRTAIAIPQLKTGDKVHIRGTEGSDGIIRICTTGTYIK